jgi:hypothetical protein
MISIKMKQAIKDRQSKEATRNRRKGYVEQHLYSRQRGQLHGVNLDTNKTTDVNKQSTTFHWIFIKLTN